MKYLLLPILILISQPAFSYELAVDIEKPSLSKKFNSGLTTRIIRVLKSQDQKYEIIEEISVLYDLWDETYTITNRGKTEKVKKIDDVYKKIKEIEIDPDEKNKTLKVIYVVNPVKKEKSKKIKEWIAERNVATGEGGIFNGIINRVVMGNLSSEIYGGDEKYEFDVVLTDKKGGQSE